jgi:hypothetical protein
MAARLRYARFPFHKTIDDFDFEFQPSIDGKLVEDIATLRLVEENRPVVFLGQPGCGKTHLAVALAICAVEAGWRATSPSADLMCRQLVAATIDGSSAVSSVIGHPPWLDHHSQRQAPPSPGPDRTKACACVGARVATRAPQSRGHLPAIGGTGSTLRQDPQEGAECLCERVRVTEVRHVCSGQLDQISHQLGGEPLC